MGEYPHHSMIRCEQRGMSFLACDQVASVVRTLAEVIGAV